MGEKKREGFAPPALGGSSLLVVFAVLALTVFALLSLSTVRADVRLGDTAEQAVSDYYTADCQAQTVLTYLRTGETLPDGIDVSETITHYPARVERLCSYVVPISDSQELQVEVLVTGSDYKVLRWQAASAGEWEADNSLELWDGDFIF